MIEWGKKEKEEERREKEEKEIWIDEKYLT